MEFLKNLISSLSYGRYRLVPNRGTFWENFPLLRTFSCFHCFHFHYVLFFAISFQTPLKNPSRRASGTKASGFVPPALRAGFLRGVIKTFNWMNLGEQCPSQPGLSLFTQHSVIKDCSLCIQRFISNSLLFLFIPLFHLLVLKCENFA